jgi:hypothetical protein
MELDELKNRVDSLKQAQKKGPGDLRTKELPLCANVGETPYP